MYLPAGLRKRAEAPGSVIVGGAALLSLAYGAVAFGWIGLGVSAFVLVVLLAVELWREASALDAAKSDLEDELADSRSEASRVPELQSRVQLLSEQVDDLLEEGRQPSLEMEQILEGLASHIEFIQLAQKHRAIRDTVEDAPVTRIELDVESGIVTASVVFAQGREAVLGEALALVDADGEYCGMGNASPAYGGHTVQIALSLDRLSAPLAQELSDKISFNPQGLVATLAGLWMPDYQDVSDNRLEETRKVFVDASEALARALTQTSTADLDDTALDDARLGELEGLPEGWVEFDPDGGGERLNSEEEGQ